ncbi:MAG: ABC transporter permease, partial [Chloroflexota bacterium]|nr:ABC transporter permease [Chloroflexota bacterium]
MFMLRNYIKVALRNLIRNKSYAFINIGGLTLGIVCAFIIFLIVNFEYSFDTYHKNASDTYRLVDERKEHGNVTFGTGVPYPLPEAFKEEFPQVEHLSIVDANFSPSVVLLEEGNERKKFSLQSLSAEFAYVNSDYFKIFDHEWLLGDPETALNRPGTLVISQPIAQKLFGNENPMGKTVTFFRNNENKVEITGVVRKIPANTNLPFNMLSYAQIPEWAIDNWSSVGSSTQLYFTVRDNQAKESIVTSLNSFVNKYGLEDEGEELTYNLQPLKELHFDTQYDAYGHSTSKASLLALGLIGLFLLITACINFVNLNTAVAVKRSKEVGVRKVLGGTRGQLVSYFLVETGLVTLIAIVIALGLSDLALKYVSSFMNYGMELTFITDLHSWIFFGTILLAVTVLAGLYPALVLSGFNPIEAIRNKITARYGKGLSLRRALVVLQFTISQVLIIATLVIWSQMDYVDSVDMGFSKEAIIEVPLPNPTSTAKNQFRNGLSGKTSILNASFTNTGTASSNIWGDDFTLYDDDEIKEGFAQAKFIDEHFLDTYELNLIAGNPIRETASDSVTQFLVNESLAKEMGYADNLDNLIGKEISFWGGKRAQVVGIVNNFNTSSLHLEIQPVIMMIDGRQSWAGIKIDPRNIQDTIASIREAWIATWPDYVFSYQFLDEKIAQFYEEERKNAQLINTFT